MESYHSGTLPLTRQGACQGLCSLRAFWSAEQGEAKILFSLMTMTWHLLGQSTLCVVQSLQTDGQKKTITTPV